jgi:hypothetical protein
MNKLGSYTNFELFKGLLRDSDRKPLFKILTEIIQLMLLHRTIPQYYFSRYLFKSYQKNIKEFLPNKFLYNLKKNFNEKGARDVLENKLYFDFFYRQFDLCVPTIIMYNNKHSFILGDKSHEIKSVDAFKKILLEVISNQLGGNPVFIKKTYGSYNGENIYKVSSDSIKQNHELLLNIYHEVIKTGYLFQETVKQHPELDRLNSSCLNTLRIDTFLNAEGFAEIISSYFKTNLKNHYIDNERSGACEIPVDLQTGKLKKHGFLTLKMNGLALPAVHPVTKVQFQDFQIPYFDEAKILVLKAASYVPSLRLVGWDVAIGPTGPILIEGNSDYDIAASDLSFGGYGANPVFQKVLKEIKEG